LNDEQFEEYLDVVPLYAQQYAKSFIEGFDAMKPEIQESLLAAIAIDPAAFLDLSRNARGEIRTLSKSIALDIPAAFDSVADGFTLNLSAGTDIGEVMRKAFANGFSGTMDDMIDLLDESGVDLNAVDIQAYARAIGEAVETSALLETNFAAGVERAEELMKTIGDERISNAVDLVAPSLRNLADFTKEELAEIGEAGGIASVNAIQPILNKMEDSMFEPTIGKMMVDGVMTDQVIRTAEENAEIIRKAFIKAATSDNSQAALYDLWQQATRTGIINGISLKPNEAIPLVTAIENAFSDVDLSPVTIEVEQLVKDFAKISEIVKKAPSQLSTEELQMLTQYPELFEDYMNGSLGSLNDYFATAKEGILDTLNEFKDSLG
jgi:DNA-binding protein